MRVVLATVAAGTTSEDPRVCEWRRTAAARGWRDVRVLGLGEPWHGFRTKTALFLALCERLPADTLVVATDAYDLLVGGCELELVRKFHALPPGKGVVIGAESVLGPNTPSVAALERLPPRIQKRYVNSGVVIGTAGILRRLFAHSLRVSPHDDQIGVGSFANAYPKLIHVDTHQRFVLNLNFGSELGAQCWWNKVEKRFSFHLEPSDEKQRPPSAPVTRILRVEYPVFIHTPFVSRDLGFRDRYVRGRLLRDNGDATYRPRSRATHCRMAFRHIWMLTQNDPVYQRLVCSISVAMASASAMTLIILRMAEDGRGQDNTLFWPLCGGIALAIMLAGNGWYLHIIKPGNARYLIEVFLLLAVLEAICALCTAIVVSVLLGVGDLS